VSASVSKENPPVVSIVPSCNLHFCWLC
jgi:hypothetical protein